MIDAKSTECVFVLGQSTTDGFSICATHGKVGVYCLDSPTLAAKPTECFIVGLKDGTAFCSVHSKAPVTECFVSRDDRATVAFALLAASEQKNEVPVQIIRDRIAWLKAKNADPEASASWTNLRNCAIGELESLLDMVIRGPPLERDGKRTWTEQAALADSGDAEREAADRAEAQADADRGMEADHAGGPAGGGQ